MNTVEEEAERLMLRLSWWSILILILIFGCVVYWGVSKIHEHEILTRNARALSHVGAAIASSNVTVRALEDQHAARTPAEARIDSSIRAQHPRVQTARSVVARVAASSPRSTSDSLSGAVATFDTSLALLTARGDSLARDTLDLSGEKKSLRSALEFVAKDDSVTHGTVDQQARDLHAAHVTETWLWITLGSVAVVLTLGLTGHL